MKAYLWLPIANIFGVIIGQSQGNMLQLNQAYSDSLTLFSPTGIANLIDLVMGIVGYFTIPDMTNYIIHTRGHYTCMIVRNLTNRSKGGRLTVRL